MRGGLDDALDKLARRDELRRRATGESPGTPPEVTELVEAIAAVISRHPNLNVTVGVEGAGDPTLLHFAFADGVVQVSADHTVAARATEATRHADFEIEVEEPVEEPPPPAYQPAAPPRGSHDDQDRFGPTDFGHPEPPTAERPYVSPASPVQNGYHQDQFATPPQGQPAYGYPDPAYGRPPGETSGDVAAQMRPAGDASQDPIAHPFAPTPPPPVPPHHPQAYAPPAPSYTPAPPPASPFAAPHAEPQPAFTEQQPVYAEPQPVFVEPEQVFPEPLAHPIPLKVERPEETELAARRLAAMLRDDPTLLDNPPQ